MSDFFDKHLKGFFEDIKADFGKSFTHNWDELKQTGNVTETTETANGITTVTKKYVSNDGSVEITSSNSSYENKPKRKKISIEERLKEIEADINAALIEQDYEAASELRMERDLLRNKVHASDSVQEKIKEVARNTYLN